MLQTIVVDFFAGVVAGLATVAVGLLVVEPVAVVASPLLPPVVDVVVLAVAFVVVFAMPPAVTFVEPLLVVVVRPLVDVIALVAAFGVVVVAVIDLPAHVLVVLGGDAVF